MTTCVFRYCKNSSRNVSESSGVSFHRFVKVSHPKREEWIKVLQEDRSENTWLPSRFSFVCSAHFLAGDIYKTKAGKRFLKKSAVPCSNPLEPSLKNITLSPKSIDEVLSDSESIFDSPREIKLKKDLRKVNAARKLLSRKVMNLQRQNKHYRKKTEYLTGIVKDLKKKLRINKQIQNELIEKAKVLLCKKCNECINN